MVKLTPLLYSAPLIFHLVLADPLQDLCETLRSLGLKKLSAYISDVAAANTPTGQHFIGILSTGNAGPMTLFAPTDQACQQWQGGEQQWNQGGQQGQPGANTGNPNVYASDQGQSSANEQTPARREESESPTPDLQTAIEGKDRGQVVAWSNVTGTDGKTRMLNQDYAQGNNSAWDAHEVRIPSLSCPTISVNQSRRSLLDALDASNGYGSHGFTVFAASDAAVMRAKEMIPAMTLNDPYAMATVMQNHIINGTTIYSPTLCSSAYPFYAIASSGGPLTFMVNNTGTFVTINHNDGGPIHSARILSTELLAHNGVVHVVDSILMSPYRDDNAAYVAYNQAAAMASQPFIPEQGPVGLPSSLPIGTGNGIGGAL
ncbi:FAS1 domain-containing protein [Salix suchowensis]|nr:FAS1 domain-containing protein [Salix suchowensis]